MHIDINFPVCLHYYMYLNIVNKPPFALLNNRLPTQYFKPLFFIELLLTPSTQSPVCAVPHKEHLSTHHRQSLALISLNVVSRGGSGICIQRY